jgi:hypothetical protein
VHSVARGGGLGASGNARGCAREQGGATPAMPEALSRTVRCEGPPALGRPRRSWQLGQPSRHRRTVALPCDGLAAHEDRQGGEQREHQDLGELHQRVRAGPAGGVHGICKLYGSRTRGGEGPPWGCTVIPLVGDTFIVMQPQVTLTSGMAHTCAAPGAQPQVGHIYVCVCGLTSDARAWRVARRQHPWQP